MPDLSNEELVIRIKNGEMNLIPVLWEQIERLIAWHARRYFNLHSADSNLHYEVDDLIQESYFAMIQAIEYYKPGEWLFSTYLGQTIKTAFAKVSGKRERSQCNNPLNNSFRPCASLDAPLSEDADETLLDFILADENDYQNVENKIYNNQLHKALDRALKTLTDDKAQLLREIYYDGKSEIELSEKYGCSHQNIGDKKHDALSRLRIERKENGLEAFLADNINYYTNVGVTQFNNTWISSTEKVVLARERFEEEYRRKQAKIEKAAAAKREKFTEKVNPSKSRRNKTLDELMKKYNIP